ncbi:MAG: Stp1/IreP family PP2C-type Ser/Thr phosphatase [Clostridia bacterium]
MEFVAKTDVGQKRTNNEDAYFAKIYDKDMALFIVADGLGGYKSGEVASQMIVELVSKYFEENFNILRSLSVSKIKTMLEGAICISSKKIYELEKTDEKYKGMGTTIVAVFKINNFLYYLSVGDSRIYHIDTNIVLIEQITQDDTYVNELVRTKIIDLSQVDAHPQKHVLTKALGVFSDIKVNLNILDKYTGYLLLCSDGVTNSLKDNEIINIFKKNKFENIAQKIVIKANDNGGTDNITALIVKL